jgi:hypothetical protein
VDLSRPDATEPQQESAAPEQPIESPLKRRPSTKERLALWQKKLEDDADDGAVESKGNRAGKKAFSVTSDGDRCAYCEQLVYLNEKVSVDGTHYHKHCFRCSVSECKKLLSPGTYAAMTGTIYCKPCFKKMFKLKGNYDEVGPYAFRNPHFISRRVTHSAGASKLQVPLWCGVRPAIA